MTSYKINRGTGATVTSRGYRFASEGNHLISPQAILASNPQMLLDIPGLDIQSGGSLLVSREYPTSRGPIDILIITASADVVIIETKLLRNSESHRTVVAQAIDYVKAFSNEAAGDLIEKLRKSGLCDKEVLAELRGNDYWRAALNRNVETGNFQVVIIGDEIHPNVLGMVESIQSAPHLAFTLFLAELGPVAFDDDNIIVSPRIVSRTLEVERSVIRIEIDHEARTHKIESETPEKGGKGTKPIVTPGEYLENLSLPHFQSPIEKFWDKWQELGGDMRFGTVGFSAGITLDGTRTPLQYAYSDYICLINEKHRLKYGISDGHYHSYKEDLKPSSTVYDSYCIGNKVDVPFNAIDVDDLEVILRAALNLLSRLIERDSAGQ